MNPQFSPALLSLLSTNLKSGGVTAEKFTVLPDVNLENGGTIISPNKEKIKKLLEPSETFRHWLIFNVGDKTINLYHEPNPASLRTPWQLLPGLYIESSPHSYKLPVYGLSLDGAGIIQPSYYYI